MRARVLGAAAGGGFPQWNSNAAGCQRVRAGDRRAKARTQASLAVSVDDESWFLLNASPDLRAQIDANEQLWPRQGLRSSPIAGVVLTGGDVDAVAGLLTLRERHPFVLCATPEVHAVLAGESVQGAVERHLQRHRDIRLAILPDEAELHGEPEETSHAFERYGVGHETRADLAVVL